ncbi:ATP-dependent DNA helicase Q-like 4B [Dendronephthya gigantea]|uniref:ATP-dependent DNA helicase Q-like 4B n=1 Tax=Dendronephthya gigantea TaxID=151771 RepID=UPI00106A802D|nr:ATP-dependent DNA helicase Q-like 4B [Dendronephthya gigantea]
MADAKAVTVYSENEIREILVKVEKIPYFEKDKIFNYKVSALNTVANLTCSSSFESATKFGFLLMHVGLENSEITVYNVEVGSNSTPHISLVKIQRTAKDDSSNDMQSEPSDVLYSTKKSSTLNKDDFGSLESLVEKTLNNIFNHQSFKPLQKEIISATMDCKNVLGVLGTGGGKSLTFMLPAVLADKPTIVVVPTLSLIDDLLHRCLALSIAACKITGDVPDDARDSSLRELNAYTLIFCTPEMFVNKTILDKFKSISIERIVFDEAHTICSWGNTFRPHYKVAAIELAKFPCPKLLLSATIPHQLILELLEMFGRLEIIKGTVLRYNIVLSIEEKPLGNKFYDKLAQFVQNRNDECGIIYGVFPSDVSKLHSELLKRNVKCVKYHSQLSQLVKDASYQKWTSGEVKVMVANASFGMGVDNTNVRFVIHAKMPTNLDEYFQQCGRAGRDGQRSTCILYYNYADKTALLKLFHGSGDFAMQSVKLNQLILFLEDPVTCRHSSILKYYGENQEGYMCGESCDNCKHRGTYIKTDGTSDAFKVVQAVLELSGTKINCQTLKLFLTGSSRKFIKDNELDKFSTFGCLQKAFKPVILLDKFLHSLIVNDVLLETVEVKNTTFSVNVYPGSKAHLVLKLENDVEKYCKV